jgi:hypothetical protein
VFIPPFDDPLVIAGQGTVGMEIIRQFSLPGCQGIQPGSQLAAQPPGPTSSISNSVQANGSLLADPPSAQASLPGGSPNGALSHRGAQGSRAADTSIEPAVEGGSGACCDRDEPHSCSLHAVFVPVGGGGLVAGIAAYIKTLQPEVSAPASLFSRRIHLHSAVRLQCRPHCNLTPELQRVWHSWSRYSRFLQLGGSLQTFSL